MIVFGVKCAVVFSVFLLFSHPMYEEAEQLSGDMNIELSFKAGQSLHLYSSDEALSFQPCAWLILSQSKGRGRKLVS